MRIVDSHCHVSLSWYEPVESLLFQMDSNGVEAAILVQMQGQFDNSYQSQCVKKHPGRFASVVIVDSSRYDASAALERLAAEGASGVRFRASARSPGLDPLEIWRTAQRLGLSVSCAGSPGDFAGDDFAQVVSSVPELRIVIEHLGGAGAIEGGPAEPGETTRKAFALARFPNVYMKIHGLGEFCRRASPVADPFPFERPIPPLLASAYQAFGAERIMWGSDFPPVSAREGYANALRLTLDQLAGLENRGKELIFGRVATSVFPIRT